MPLTVHAWLVVRKLRQAAKTLKSSAGGTKPLSPPSPPPPPHAVSSAVRPRATADRRREFTDVRPVRPARVHATARAPAGTHRTHRLEADHGHHEEALPAGRRGRHGAVAGPGLRRRR